MRASNIAVLPTHLWVSETALSAIPVQKPFWHASCFLPRMIPWEERIMRIPAGIRAMTVIALFLACIAAPTLAPSRAAASHGTVPRVPLA